MPEAADLQSVDLPIRRIYPLFGEALARVSFQLVLILYHTSIVDSRNLIVWWSCGESSPTQKGANLLPSPEPAPGV